MPTDIARIHAVFDLAMRVGEGMLSNGAAASEVTATVLRITSSSGLRNVAVQVTFDEVSISYLADEMSTPFTRIRACGGRAQDFGRLEALEQITISYVQGEIPLEEARHLAEQIPLGKPMYSLPLVVAGFAVLGGGAAVSLGAGTLVMIAATITGGLLILLATLLGRRQIPLFYTQAVSGFVGVVGAVVVSLINPAVNSSIVVVACIIVMLAGLTSIGAMQDAITGWYITASGRILEALMLTVGLVVGVRGGILVAEWIGVDISVSGTMPISLVSVMVMSVSGAVIGLGFAIGSYAAPRHLLWIALIAGMAGVLSHVLTLLLHDSTFAVGATSMVIGAVSVVLADRFRAPALMYVMSGVIPMVPGMRLYRGLLALGDDVVAGGFELLTATEIALAIAAGAVLGQLIASRLVRRLRRTGIAYTPVISSPFTTLRRRRASVSGLWRRRRGQGVIVEPSTMTGEMTALTPAMLADLEHATGAIPAVYAEPDPEPEPEPAREGAEAPAPSAQDEKES